MGLFVRQDGHYRTWLSAILCCFAAVTEDEHPVELQRPRPTTRTEVCSQQPTPITALPRPATSVWPTDFKDDELASRPEDDYYRSPPGHTEPPSLKPLDLGDSSLLGPRLKHKKRRSLSLGHTKAPSISDPSFFRRLESTDGQRASLVPLKLGPVVLKDSPRANDPETAPVSDITETYARKRSDSTLPLLQEQKRASYRAQRETPFQRCQQSSLTALPVRPSSTSRLVTGRASSPVPPVTEQGGRPKLTREVSSSSLHRHAVEAQAYTVTRGSSSDRDRNKLKRKRSLQSVPKQSSEHAVADIEKEILELNTIVEERRAGQVRPQSPAVQHIAAIAPSMQLRARSETLNDIGSALARPLTAREPHRINTSFDPPDRATRPSTSRTTSRTSLRVSGWLSSLLPTTTNAPPTTTEHQEPFYKCIPPSHPRASSQASLCASTATVTELESPLSLTATSSPISRGHARSLTAESRLSPSSPPSTIYDHDLTDAVRKEAEGHWPVEVAHSQVGLAL